MAGVLDELLQNVRQNDRDWKNAKDAIVLKGVPVPEGTPTSEYGEKILSIESGVDTSGDTVVPSALREGYTAHNAAGQEITGTIPDYSGGNTVEMTSPEGATLNTAGTYCEGNIEVVPKLQRKTATTGEIVTADSGYVGLESVDTNPAFEAGKKSEYDAFWDAMQENGARKSYSYFGAAVRNVPDIWKRAKYPVVAVGYCRGFLHNFNTPLSAVNGGEGGYGVPLDLSSWSIDSSGVTDATEFAANATISNVFFDLSNATTLYTAFYENDRGVLDYITLKVSEKCTNFALAFMYNNTVKNFDAVRFAEGSVIAAQGLNLSYCNQSK